MSQLNFASIPGFFDLADSAIAAGQPLTDDAISKISHNAKFGAVRAEQFYMGFYANGNTVSRPVSPVDGYAYSYAECLFFLIHASSLSPAAGFVPGQALFPPTAPNAGAGALLASPYQMTIEPSGGTNPGLVSLSNYYSTSGPVNEGTVAVYCLAQRLSVGG
jgi:hypothetical protein